MENPLVMNILPNLHVAISMVREKLIDYGYIVRTEKWQGIPLEYDMWETLNTTFNAIMPDSIDELRETVKPNLPWADIHFDERVGGIPLNPGESYKVWPFYKMDTQMRTVGELFTHTYMERLWPKIANNTMGSVVNNEDILMGIRYQYGDFTDLINLLYNEPFTRQAFLPIWFPEDTGAMHGGRIPCTIGYHFIRRDNRLNVIYYIRSCDYRRHFRDDIYLAVRKVYYIIDRLKSFDSARGTTKWGNVKPGIFTMHITSLHIFQNELWAVKKEK